MDLLRSVLEERAVDLASALTVKAGLTTEEARRFVPEAGTGLIESWRWQASTLDKEDVAAESNVQELLRGIGAKRIASRVGLTTEATWSGLRAFVPMVMRLAGEGVRRMKGGDRGSEGGGEGFESLEIGFGLRLVRRTTDRMGWTEVMSRDPGPGDDSGDPTASWSPIEHAIFGYGLRAPGRPRRDGGSVSFS
jgi:hypothetical protein